MYAMGILVLLDGMIGVQEVLRKREREDSHGGCAGVR